MAQIEATESLAAQHARALWEEGLSIIPLGSPHENPPAWFVKDRCGGNAVEAREKWPKTPRIAWKAYQDREPTIEELEQWIAHWPDANYAIVTGRDKLIVPDADNPAAVAFMESGAVTRTPRKVTTAKGAHYYYRARPGQTVRNSANSAGIDIRGEGGYVVAPGSVHESGVIYTQHITDGWGDASWAELPYLTDEDLAAIAAFNAGGSLPANGAGNLAGFNAAAVRLPATGEPVAEGGRNNAAASLAGRAIQAGASLAEVKAQLDQWNATNARPLAESELNTTIASVARTHVANNPGAVIPVVPAPPYVPARLNAFNAGQFKGMALEQVEWLWDQWIARRVTHGIFAEGGTGKSQFMLQLAVCMATGKPFIDGSILPYGKSLLVMCEDEMRLVHLRLDKILKTMGLTWDDLDGHIWIVERVGNDSLLMEFGREGKGVLTKLWHDLDATIADIGADLVMLDTANDTYGGNPIDNQQVRFFIQQAYTSLAIKHNCALVFLSHVSVSGKAAGTGMSGATAWRDRARVQIYMAQDDGESAIRVIRKKANYAKQGVEFKVHNDNGYLIADSGANFDDQINELARVDFLTLMEIFEKQGTRTSPAANSGDYAPTKMAEYVRLSRKKFKTTKKDAFAGALVQLLEAGQIRVVVDPRSRVKSLEIVR